MWFQLDRRKEYYGIWYYGSLVIELEGMHMLWKGLMSFATHLTLKYTLCIGSNALLQLALADAKNGSLVL